MQAQKSHRERTFFSSSLSLKCNRPVLSLLSFNLSLSLNSRIHLNKTNKNTFFLPVYLNKAFFAAVFTSLFLFQLAQTAMNFTSIPGLNGTVIHLLTPIKHKHKHNIASSATITSKHPPSHLLHQITLSSTPYLHPSSPISHIRI